LELALAPPPELGAARVRENWSSGLTEHGAMLAEQGRDVNSQW